MPRRTRTFVAARALPSPVHREPGLWRLYRPLVWAFALASALVWLPSAAGPWQLIFGLILLGNLADRSSITIQQGMRVSAAHFAAPFAVITTSVTGGLIVAAGVLAGRLLFARRDWNSFDVAVNIAATSIAGAAWELSMSLSDGDVVIGSVLTIVVFAMARSAINLGWAFETRARGIEIPPVTLPVGRLMLAAAMLFTPAIALVQLDDVTPLGGAILLVLPFIATNFLIRAYGREWELNEQLEAANLSVTESLVNALDARDPYSAGHSIAVAVYSRDIASELSLSPDEIRRTYLAGLLHDIGKIAVPDAILRKPAALTDAEYEEIQLHPVIGEQILAPSKHLQDVLPGVRHHHERIDGKGYPDRLSDADIPLQARIIAVADAYNAMTSERPYRDALTPKIAVRVLVQNQGMQHDPFVVAAFRRVLDRHDESYALAKSQAFATAREMRELISGADHAQLGTTERHASGNVSTDSEAA